MKFRDSVRLLFLNFSSTFNTIIPQTLIHKQKTLGLSPSSCNWILDFLTNSRETVRIPDITSSGIIIIINTVHQGAQNTFCWPTTAQLYSQTPTLSSSQMTQQWWEHLEAWCRANSLCIYVKKNEDDDHGCPEHCQEPSYPPLHNTRGTHQ